MSFFKKIHHTLEKAHRKVGLGKTASKFIARSLTGDSIGAIRSLQRSHSFGRLGKTLLPSFSDKNYITKAYNKLMSKIGSVAVRNASRVSNSASSVRTQTAMPVSTSQRLDYNYRRLSDLT